MEKFGVATAEAVQAETLAQVIEFFRKCPAPHGSEATYLEVRAVYDVCDFPDDALSPELKERERELRKQVADRG